MSHLTRATTPNQQIFTDATNAFTALGYNTNLLFEEGMATGSGTPSPLLTGMLDLTYPAGIMSYDRALFKVYG